MPRGGLRAGAGRPRGVTPVKPLVGAPPPPVDGAEVVIPPVKSGREYLLAVLNAPDTYASVDQKVRAAQALTVLERQEAAKAKPGEAAADPATGAYAPRKVRTFGVVNGDR